MATDGTPPAVTTAKRPSVLVGSLVTTGLLLFATIAGLRLLEFDALAAIVAGFTLFAANVLPVVVVLFGLGMYLASRAADGTRASAIRSDST